MKIASSLLMVTLLATANARGQGQFLFTNYDPPHLDAPFILPYNYCGGYFPLQGPDWKFEFRGGPVGSGLQPLQEFTVLQPGSAAGYVVPVIVTVPDIPAGSNAAVLVRITYMGIDSHDYGPFTMTLGSSQSGIPRLPFPEGSRAFEVPFYAQCPEPSSLVLALVGIGIAIAYGCGRKVECSHRRRVPATGLASARSSAASF